MQDASGLLAVFNQAGVLNPADVHSAATVCRIGDEADESVRLALALTVRALRNGSVCIDLRTVHATAFDEAESAIDVAELPWPEPEEWLAACKASPLVADGAARPGGRPLRLAGDLLYLERYWQQEELVRTAAAATFRRSGSDDRPIHGCRPRYDGCSTMKASHRTRPTASNWRLPSARWAESACWPAARGLARRTTVARLLALLARSALDRRRVSRWPRRPAKLQPVWRRRYERRPLSWTWRISGDWASFRPRRCIDCWAGCPRIAAGSDTMPRTSCRTTS